MPHVSLSEIARAFKQCQNYHRPETEVTLWSCSGCHRAHYCSRECQVADRPRHRGVCRHNAETQQQIRQEPILPQLGVTPNDINKVLNKWIQIFRPLLSLSAYHALSLETTPDNCLVQTLNLILSPTFSANNMPRKAKQYKHAFRLDLTVVVDIADFIAEAPNVRQAFEDVFEQTRRERANNPNVIGVPVVMVLVPKARTMRQVPVGLEHLELQWDPLWEINLKRRINTGNPL